MHLELLLVKGGIGTFKCFDDSRNERLIEKVLKGRFVLNCRFFLCSGHGEFLEWFLNISIEFQVSVKVTEVAPRR
jgi:hypothetical protein